MYTSYFPKLLIEINKRGEKESAKIGLACAPAYAYARMGWNGKPPVYWCTWCTDPFNQACPTYHKDLRHIDGLVPYVTVVELRRCRSAIGNRAPHVPQESRRRGSV